MEFESITEEQIRQTLEDERVFKPVGQASQIEKPVQEVKPNEVLKFIKGLKIKGKGGDSDGS